MAKRTKTAAPSSEGKDDWFPLDPDEHDRQLRGVLKLLGKTQRRVLDLGSGDGRIAGPLVKAGHEVVAVDCDARAVRACRALGAETLRGDAFSDSVETRVLWGRIDGAGPFDGALCLGNTFILLTTPADVVRMLRELRKYVPAGGFLAIDDFASLWREVAEGFWQEGVSEDGSMRLKWAAGDNVLTLTKGKATTPMRLWSRGELQLLAMASGWGMPVFRPRDHLCIFKSR